MQIWRDQVYVHMYEHELAGYDGIVAACVVRFFGDRLGVVDDEGTLEEVQQQAGDSTPYAYSIRIVTGPEDREFFARWAALYRRAWPDVGVYSMHPVLHRANKIFDKALERWLERYSLQRKILRRHNRLHADSDDSDSS